MVASLCYKLESDLVDCFIAGVLQPEVDHRVLERPAHVELQRQIIHPLDTRKRKIRKVVFSEALWIKDALYLIIKYLCFVCGLKVQKRLRTSEQ